MSSWTLSVKVFLWSEATARLLLSLSPYLTLASGGWTTHTAKCGFLFSLLLSAALFPKLSSRLAAFPLFLEGWASWASYSHADFLHYGFMSSVLSWALVPAQRPLHFCVSSASPTISHGGCYNPFTTSREPLISFPHSIMSRRPCLFLPRENIWPETSEGFISPSSSTSEAFPAQCGPPWRMAQHGCHLCLWVPPLPPLRRINRSFLSLPMEDLSTNFHHKPSHWDFVCP